MARLRLLEGEEMKPRPSGVVSYRKMAVKLQSGLQEEQISESCHPCDFFFFRILKFCLLLLVVFLHLFIVFRLSRAFPRFQTSRESGSFVPPCWTLRQRICRRERLLCSRLHYLGQVLRGKPLLICFGRVCFNLV